jgi:glycine cleavage system H protein
MATVNNCQIPEELYYLVEKHVWVRVSPDGSLTIGMSDVAQHLAGDVLTVTPKKAGRSVQKGQSVATMESAKWVGPVPAPVGGEIVEVNQALPKNPRLVNQDPYGEGWFVKLKPSNWEIEKGSLVSGAAGVEAYRAFLDAQGVRCGEQAAG